MSIPPDVMNLLRGTGACPSVEDYLAPHLAELAGIESYAVQVLREHEEQARATYLGYAQEADNAARQQLVQMEEAQRGWVQQMMDDATVGLRQTLASIGGSAMAHAGGIFGLGHSARLAGFSGHSNVNDYLSALGILPETLETVLGYSQAQAPDLFGTSRLVKDLMEEQAQSALRVVREVSGHAALDDFAADFLRNTFDEHARNILGDADFAALRAAAQDAGHRIQGHWDDDEDITSLDEIEDAVAEADLGSVRKVVDDAVALAVQKAIAQGQLKDPAAVQRFYFYLTTLVGMLMTAASIIGQPIFAHWYEEQRAEPAAPAPTKARPSVARGTVLVAAKDSRIYRGPHSTQQVMVTVSKGHILRSIRTTHGWVLVRYVDPQADGVSYTGWMRAKSVKPVAAETAKLIWCALTAPSNGSCED